MRIARPAGLLIATLLLASAAFAAAACGGDDAASTPATPTPYPTPRTKVNDSTGTDENFVTTICKASDGLVATLQRLFTEGSQVTDFQKLSAALDQPLTEFINGFAGANPPADLVQWHRDATAALEAVAAQVSTGQGFDKLFGDSPIPEMPAGARTRLISLVNQQPGCVAANFALGTGGRGGSLDRALGGGRRGRTPTPAPGR